MRSRQPARRARCSAGGVTLFLALLSPAMVHAQLVAGDPQHRYELPGTQVFERSLFSGPDSARVRVETRAGRTTVIVRLDDDEAIWGFGQRFDAFDLRGRSFEIWAEDGWNQTHTSYFAIPWFISSAGYGVFVNSTGRLRVDVGVAVTNELRIEMPENAADVRAFRGTPREILAAYTELVGRPHSVPDWVFQPWISRNSYLGAHEIDRTIALMNAFQLRAGAVVLEAWEQQFHNFRFETERYPDPAKWIRSLHERGYHVICWTTSSIWPHGSTYDEAKRRNFLVKYADGSEYVTRWIENGRELDFRMPDVRDFWRDLQIPLIEMGVDGIKTDGGEHMPDRWFHNEHPFHYQRASLDAFDKVGRPGITFARSGNPLVAGNSTFWAGDQHAAWPSLAVVVRGGLSAALSGLFYWGHDIGGYSGTPTKPLYIRWLQIGAFSPIMQLHGISAREPWLYDAQTLEIAQLYFRVREKLQPYLIGLAREAREEGHPMWRPLAWTFPEDRATFRIGDQFMLGDDLLVAPILNEEGTREIYLPAGQWVNLWTDRTLEGPTNLSVAVDISMIPVFARAEAHTRWKDLFKGAPAVQLPPFSVQLAGAQNERGIVPPIRYLRDNSTETISYLVSNNTASAASGSAILQLPPGFTAPSNRVDFTLPPRGSGRIDFPVTPAADLEPGTYAITLNCRVGAHTLDAPDHYLAQSPRWKAIGPLEGGVGSKQALDGTSPDLAAPVTGRGGLEVHWKELPLSAMGDDGYWDVGKIIGGEGGTTSFAHTRFTLKSARRVRLALDSGDSMAVWVNGRLVCNRIAHRNPSPAPILPEDVPTADLRAGENEILVRVSRGIAPNQMYVRILNAR